MKLSIALAAIAVVFQISSCAERPADVSTANATTVSNSTRSESAAGEDASVRKPEASDSEPSGGEPRTIRDFFMLLPEEYFVLEGCDRAKDKGCKKAKQDYLKNFTEVEDIANGYLKGGCDGGQSCLEMTIFKRPDKSYLVAVSTESEMIIEQHFLNYSAGKWTDVSADVVPEFGKDKIYELPRQGTTMKVFAKKVIEKGEDFEVAEKGSKLYDLAWKDGKFSISK